MKYSYNTRVLEVGSHKMMLITLNEELEPVSVFLNNDVTGEEAASYFTSKINKVLNGEEAMYTTGGNTCSLTIRPDFTDIEEKYLEKRRVQIETSELILLIEAFLLEKRIYMDNIDR